MPGFWILWSLSNEWSTSYRSWNVYWKSDIVYIFTWKHKTEKEDELSKKVIKALFMELTRLHYLNWGLCSSFLEKLLHQLCSLNLLSVRSLSWLNKVILKPTYCEVTNLIIFLASKSLNLFAMLFLNHFGTLSKA